MDYTRPSDALKQGARETFLWNASAQLYSRFSIWEHLAEHGVTIPCKRSADPLITLIVRTLTFT
jgi:hypothetical protein